MRIVRVKNGRYEAPDGIPRKIPSKDCWSVAVGPVEYGDVTGDGLEEAMVVLYAELGGSGKFERRLHLYLEEWYDPRIGNTVNGHKAYGVCTGAPAACFSTNLSGKA